MCREAYRNCSQNYNFGANTSLASLELLKAVEIYLIGYCLTAVVILGVLGNILAIYLFSRRTMWSRVNFYVCGIAAWDIVLLISSWSLFSLRAILYVFGNPDGVFMYSLPVSYVVCNVAMTGCVWTTVVLTIDRYMAVCQPLRHKVWFAGLARPLVIASSIAAIVYSLPRAFEFTMITNLRGNGTVKILVKDRDGFGADSRYFLIYRIVLGLLLNTAGPFAAMLILTLLMVQTLSTNPPHKSSRCPSGARKPSANSHVAHSGAYGTVSAIPSASHASRRSNHPALSRTNQLLVLILFKFLACYTLPTTLDITEKCLSNEILASYKFMTVVKISNFLVIVHSATNIFVYVCFGSKVKQELRRLTGCQGSSSAPGVRWPIVGSSLSIASVTGLGGSPAHSLIRRASRQ